MLARAHVKDPKLVSKPHDLSTIHLPVGGERFRPCLEDFLQLLIADCGVDAVPGWEGAIESGRETWRRRQLKSVVRDIPNDAVAVLRELGWTCDPPPNGTVENLAPFAKW